MTPETQRIAIAEACGWKHCRVRGGFPMGHKSNSENGIIPDYLNDLNAMHEAEKILPDVEYVVYEELLLKLCDPENKSDGTFKSTGWIRWASATAAQRAEAFLRTLNLWTI